MQNAFGKQPDITADLLFGDCSSSQLMAATHAQRKQNIYAVHIWSLSRMCTLWMFNNTCINKK